MRGLPEVFGELPAAALAEEIDTPGDGQIRALLTIAGNPVVSTPNSARLAAALDGLDFMVSVDIYVNETTRHADVILPAPSPLEKAHFDLVFHGLRGPQLRQLLAAGAGAPGRDARRVGDRAAPGRRSPPARAPDADIAAIDDFVARAAIGKEVADEHSPWHGRDVEECLAELAPRTGTARMVDLLLRTGPYDLTLADLEARPHGVDLGPLEPRMPEVLRTPSGRIELAPEALVADVPRLHDGARRAAADPEQLVLIGRRHLRSNNSWMHNLPLLVRGPERCTLHVHPDDAARLALADGAPATVRSRVGELRATVEVTEDIRPGVVSLPHGWGHDVDGVEMDVARAHAGINSNVLTDEAVVEPLTGTAVLNGIPVTLAPVAGSRRRRGVAARGARYGHPARTPRLGGSPHFASRAGAVTVGATMTSPAPSPSAVQRWTLAVVCIATAMLMLDIAVVNTALSKIADDLSTGLSGLQWVVDAYTLGARLASSSTAGSLADRFGRRRLFTVGLGALHRRLAALRPGRTTSPC